MKRFVLASLIVISLAAITGCATVYRDSSGRAASAAEEFDCEHKCGVYDTRMNAFGSAHCLINCMRSKGYRPYNE